MHFEASVKNERVAQQDSVSNQIQKVPCSDPYSLLGQALGPNLVTRHLVTATWFKIDATHRGEWLSPCH